MECLICSENNSMGINSNKIMCKLCGTIFSTKTTYFVEQVLCPSCSHSDAKFQPTRGQHHCVHCHMIFNPR